MISWMALWLAVAMQADPAVPAALAVPAELAVPAPPAVAAADLERIAAAVERAMPTGRRLEALATRQVWMTKKDQAPPDPSRDPPGMSDTHLVRLLGPGRAVVSGRQLNVINVIAEGSTYQVVLDEPVASFSRGVRDPSALGLALLLQVDLFAPLEIDRPIAAVIRGARPISLTIDGSVATLRFIDRGEEKAIDERFAQMQQEGRSTPGGRPKAWPREITVDLAEPPRVLGCAVDIPRFGPDKPSVRDEWVVESWQAVDAQMIGQRVRRRTTLGEGKPYVQITELSRVAELPAAVNSTSAAARPLPEGLRVADDRLTFTVGSADIILDGRPLRLQEPLWLHPGPRLEELVREASER